MPFLSLLKEGDHFIHYTIFGEILVAGREGLLARYRRGHWLFYEPQHLYPIFCSLFGNESLGKNVLNLLFELSYRRHGALLIFDPGHRTLAHISNAGVLVGQQYGADILAAHKLLMPTIAQIDLKSPHSKKRRKHLFCELAEIDGAIIFDTQRILAFGAMIDPLAHQSRCYGSRTLAALSAADCQAIACKVGSEGDSVVYYQDSKDKSVITELRIF